MTSPPCTSRASVFWTSAVQYSFLMLGSEVSSRTPNDFQPNSHMGLAVNPLMNRYDIEGPPGKGRIAVGMQRAFDSAIGLPSRSSSALWMLVFLIPAEVSRNFMIRLLDDFRGAFQLPH